MDALKPCVCFFIPNPNGDGIIVDNAKIFAIQLNDFLELSESERAFVAWYTRDSLNSWLDNGLIIQTENHGGPDKVLDIPQEYICERFMTAIRALSP